MNTSTKIIIGVVVGVGGLILISTVLFCFNFQFRRPRQRQLTASLGSKYAVAEIPLVEHPPNKTHQEEALELVDVWRVTAPSGTPREVSWHKDEEVFVSNICEIVINIETGYSSADEADTLLPLKRR